METKTKKVYLLVEAEVDAVEGFTEREHEKVASGYLMKILSKSADNYTEDRGVVFELRDGYVSYKRPKPIHGMAGVAFVEDGDGVHLFW